MSVPRSHALAGLLGVFAFLTYLATLSPTVNFIDSGELITVSLSLGIAHPTGYPLYTLLGRLVSTIPLGTVAWRVNLFSGLCGAGAACFISLAAMHMAGRKSIARISAALLSVAFLSLSKTMWDVSTQAEVYSLTVLLFSVLIYLVIVQWQKRCAWPLLLTAYFYGLSFGNHMMTVLLLPSFTVAVVLAWRDLPKRRALLLLWALFFFVLGLSLYLYLPLRSALDPPLDWGKPHTLERLVAHVTGWQYRVWMFSKGAGELAGRIEAIPERLVSEFTMPGTALLAAGMIGAARGRGREFFFLLTLLAAGIFYAVNYDIPDIDPYYLPAYVSLSLMAGPGTVHLLEALAGRMRKGLSPYLAVGLAVLAVVSLSRNVRETDKRENVLAYHFGRNFLAALETGSLVMTKSWDVYSPIIYLQQVEGYRTDVVMVDFELMRRSWYVEQFMERPVAHSERALAAMREFARAVLPFERGEPFDSAVLDALFKRMLGTVLEDALARGSAYIDFPDEPDLAKGYIRVPHLMSYRLTQDPLVAVPGYGSLVLEGVTNPAVPKDERTRAILERYWIIAINRGLFLAQRREFEEALAALDFGLGLVPENLTALRAKALCLESLARREEALEVVRKILLLAPEDHWAVTALSRLQ